MIIQRDESSELRPDQVRAMAQGLYWLALIEGVTERERTLLQDFLREGGVDLDLEALAGVPRRGLEIPGRPKLRAAVLRSDVPFRPSAHSLQEAMPPHHR